MAEIRRRGSRRSGALPGSPSVAELFDATPVPMLYAGADMKLGAANAAWYRTLDEAHVPTAIRDRVLGVPIPDHLIPADRELCTRVHTDHMGRTAKDRFADPSVLDLHFTWAPGTPAHTMATTVADSGGNAIGVLYACCPWERSRTYGGGEVVRMSTDVSAVRRVVSALSHEVNNPLFIVSATLEDLLSEVSDPQVCARLKVALDAVWRVSEKVKEVLDVSRAGEWSEQQP